jgi:hypothetical protein
MRLKTNKQTVSLSRCIESFLSLNHEFPSLDNKFYKNATIPINQNENFVIERLDQSIDSTDFRL